MFESTRNDDQSPLRNLAQRALGRSAGADLSLGNQVNALIDAPANYSAWLDALRSATAFVLLENYIVRDDAIGREFRAALIERAQAGVAVYVIFDWLGCLGQSRASFWRPLQAVGGEVRCYNKFQFTTPFGWVHRDHRKLLQIDRSVAFVGGLCISQKWLGDPSRDKKPWRDTAVAVRGPAVLQFEQAFVDIWNQLGTPLSAFRCQPPVVCGEVALRVIATQPDTAGIFRLDQMIAAIADKSLWLSDAYFVGLAPYVQALSAAARDGVDIRLLVPGASDLPVVAAMSRSGYRPLLQAGVRVFEWNGAMMHAKTAVADGRWARVGSSNLNIASWIGNCELDVAIEDEAFAHVMEDQYLQDLESATEIVLASRKRVCRSENRPRTKRSGGSSGRAAASALRMAHSVGAALGSHRTLSEGEQAGTPWFALGLLLIAAIAIFWPRVLAWPLALLGAWIGFTLLLANFRPRSK